MAGLLRAGVVGVGSLGQHHARIYAEMPGTTLVGVVDADPKRAAEIAARHDARVFPDVASLARELDVASVATPTVAHEEAATTLLDAAVPTLVEKPIAPDRDAGRRLVELSRARGVALMIGHTERFNPVVSAVLEAATRPRYVEVHRLAPFVRRSLDVDVILDLMIHDLDLCRVILERPRVEAFLASGSPVLTEKIDIASVRLRFEGGASANVTASRVSQERVRRLRVFEPDRMLACDAMSGEAVALDVDREEAEEPKVRPRSLVVPEGEPLGRELAALCHAVTTGTEVPVPGEDGLAALDLALTIRDAVIEDLDAAAQE